MNDSRLSSPFVAVSVFFLIAYGLAWSVMAVFHVLAPGAGLHSGAEMFALAEAMDFAGVKGDLPAPPWFLYLLTRVADFAFSLAGIIMIFSTDGRRGLVALGKRILKWRISPVWYAAGLLPLFMYTGAALVTSASTPEVGDGVALDGTTVWRALFSLEAGFFVSLFLRGAFGEELGLRGFALPRLQTRFGPAKASFVLGVGWWGWHLPVLIPRGLPTMVLLLVAIILLSFIFTWMFNGSGGSLIPCLMFHAAQNWDRGFALFVPGLAESNWESISSLGLMVIGLVVAVVMIVRQKKAARTNPSSGTGT